MEKIAKNRAIQKIILTMFIMSAVSIVFSKCTPYNRDCEEPANPKKSSTSIYIDDSRPDYNWAKLKSKLISGYEYSEDEVDKFDYSKKVNSIKAWLAQNEDRI